MTIAYISPAGNGDPADTLFDFNVIDPDTMPCAQALACLFDPPQKTRIILQAVFEQVVFVLANFAGHD